jgi:hypothetical protein
MDDLCLVALGQVGSFYVWSSSSYGAIGKRRIATSYIDRDEWTNTFWKLLLLVDGLHSSGVKMCPKSLLKNDDNKIPNCYE